MKLTKSERMELQRQASARNGRADSARHARLILLLAEGLTWAEIRAKLDCSDSYIDRWSKRFAADRLGGLFARHAGRERYKVTDRIEARVLAWTTKHKPADGSTHWSSRKLAAELGGDISHMTVARIWAKHGLKPHRLEGYLASNDPEFESQGGRRDRAVPEPAAACGGVLRGREDGDPGARPQGPGAAAVAGARRAARLRVLPPRHAVAVRRLQHQDRRGAGQDGRAPHLGRVRRLPHRHRGQPAQGQGDPRHRRQPLGAQDQAGRRSSWPSIPTFICTSLRPTRPGSTRSSCGSPRSSAT